MAKELGHYRISDQTEKSIISLRTEGLSTYKIANQLTISRPTVEKYIQLNKSIIEEMRQAKIDALKDEIEFNRIRRLELLSAELYRVETQLASRNLDDIKTQDLIRLKIQLINTMDRLEHNYETFKEDNGIDDILAEIEGDIKKQANKAK